MCGILGRLTTSDTTVSLNDFKRSLDILYRLSETRGKEASGLCCLADNRIQVIRADVPASVLVKRKEYRESLGIWDESKERLAIGHSRMVTNGDAKNPFNNQPVIRNDLIAIHNGIIVNDAELWKKYPEMDRNTEVDTEVFLALMERHDYKRNFLKAFSETVSEMEGSLSIALVDRKSNWIFLYTNVGSLYLAVSPKEDDYIFASERYILETTLRKTIRSGNECKYRIIQISSKEGLFIRLNSGKHKKLSTCQKKECIISQGEISRAISIADIQSKKIPECFYTFDSEYKSIENLISVDIDKIHRLRRCTKCLLPETFPGITYDSSGVCSVCNSYKKIKPKGKSAFEQELKKNAKIENRYDCIAPISGGRDSCYILHYLVKEMHLKPVAYTYDWGLVTDLARRNIQRMCAALGVEHILISADIDRKRSNVRKNVLAWLKKPELGTVPLFMAGDKQFFYYAQLLKRQMKVDNVIFGMNALEETQFKARFIGVRAGKRDDLYSNFSGKNKIGLALGYGREFLRNPAYINSTLWDSFTGFLSYYALPQQYFKFFDYIPWDQKTIENTLVGEYNWEKSHDLNETWRIGDGTAPFYNYIYYRMAGFTEFDTFKSNQIREGMITRDEALSQIDNSNRISVDGLLWYCKTIGIDPVYCIKAINSEKPLYER